MPILKLPKSPALCVSALLSLGLAPCAYSQSEAKKDSVKVGLRVHVDPFVKNFNDSALNLKQPKLVSLGVKVERDFGEHSQADVDFRISELDAGAKTNSMTNDKGNITSTTTFQNALRSFHLVYRTPIEGLSVGYVRELESANFGYTDRIYNGIFAGSGGSATGSGFSGHLGRPEGVKLIWSNKELSNLKVTYLIARDQNAFSASGVFKPSPKDRNWYQKVTTSSSIADTNLEAGFGIQGVWLPVTTGAVTKYENKPDLFVHATAEFTGVESLKVKAGLGWDSYATVQLQDNKDTKTAANTVTTLLLSSRYDVFKELGIIGELDYRMTKWANKLQVDYSKESKVADNKDVTNKSNDAQFILGAQYFLDSKLSVMPNYALYLSKNRTQNADTSSAAGLAPSKALVAGNERKTTGSESTLGLRIRYDY